MSDQTVVFATDETAALATNVVLTLRLGGTGNLKILKAPFPRIAKGMRRETDHRAVTSGIVIGFEDTGKREFPTETVTFNSQSVNVLDAVLLASWLDRFTGFTGTELYDPFTNTTCVGGVVKWGYTVVADNENPLGQTEYARLKYLLDIVLNPKLAQTTTLRITEDFPVLPVTYVWPAVVYRMLPLQYNTSSTNAAKVLRALYYDFHVEFKGHSLS